MDVMELILAFGSNLGNRITHIEQAIRRLDALDITPVSVSSFYETSPVEMLEQPPFVNCVGIFHTDREVFQILETVRSVEDEMGRIRTTEKGPRVVDIDLIACGMTQVYTERLKLPHPGLPHRNFVLIPLKEIDSERVLPIGCGRTVGELCAACEDRISNPVPISPMALPMDNEKERP